METYFRCLAQATPVTLTGVQIAFDDYADCMAFDRERRAVGAVGIDRIKYYREGKRWLAFIRTEQDI